MRSGQRTGQNYNLSSQKSQMTNGQNVLEGHHVQPQTDDLIVSPVN